MRKITDLKTVQLRTVHNEDEYGNRYRDQEEWIVSYFPKTVSTSQRFGHYVVDIVLLNGLFYLISIVIDLAIQNVYTIMINPAVALFGRYDWFIITFAYYFLFEYFFQKTPGKMLTKTLVIDESGLKPDAKSLALRTLIRFVPFEAFSCIGQFKSRGWYDKWSETWVVTEAELDKIKELQMQDLS